MTLKDKFSALIPLYNVNNNKSIQCEQIADDYAIEFAEWIIKGKIDKELLEIFKKEKAL